MIDPVSDQLLNALDNAGNAISNAENELSNIRDLIEGVEIKEAILIRAIRAALATYDGN